MNKAEEPIPIPCFYPTQTITVIITALTNKWELQIV